MLLLRFFNEMQFALSFTGASKTDLDGIESGTEKSVKRISSD